MPTITGLPEQARLVALLDGGEERVEVGVQDGCLDTNICSHTSPYRPPMAKARLAELVAALSLGIDLGFDSRWSTCCASA